MARTMWSDGSLERAELEALRKAIRSSRLFKMLHPELHNCYDRDLKDKVVVQSGWVDEKVTLSNGGGEIMSRIPNMIEIPFTMTKHCHQWEEPFGAIHKGLLDPKGCKGCKWNPHTPELWPTNLRGMIREDLNRRMGEEALKSLDDECPDQYMRRK